jgi:hypothetical protein
MVATKGHAVFVPFTGSQATKEIGVMRQYLIALVVLVVAVPAIWYLHRHFTAQNPGFTELREAIKQYNALPRKVREKDSFTVSVRDGSQGDCVLSFSFTYGLLDEQTQKFWLKRASEDVNQWLNRLAYEKTRARNEARSKERAAPLYKKLDEISARLNDIVYGKNFIDSHEQRRLIQVEQKKQQELWDQISAISREEDARPPETPKTPEALWVRSIDFQSRNGRSLHAVKLQADYLLDGKLRSEIIRAEYVLSDAAATEWARNWANYFNHKVSESPLPPVPEKKAPLPGLPQPPKK